MAAAAGILNHHETAAQALAAKTATPAAATSSSSSSSSGDSATISANDFLTLLVTEMQNQDPTADTDPNEYINQLVNVNSLEQLISINQTLTTDLGTPATGSSATASTQASGATTSLPGGGAGAQPAIPGAAPSLPASLNAAVGKLAPGNLGIPAAIPAAQSVAQALSGRPRVQ